MIAGEVQFVAVVAVCSVLQCVAVCYVDDALGY